MFRTIQVIGRGRLGAAVAARLGERGLLAERDAAELVMLCVPDSAIAGVAREVGDGPWVAHTSGATPMSALDPHTRRFTLHPLQTFTRARGAEQLDGAWAAVSAETDTALARGWWLAEQLGLHPFQLDESWRALYHCGAAMASNFLVTLFRASASALETSGVPPDALVPLMRRTIENHFELTGPIARGDRATVEAHLAALRAHLPDLEPMYRALADATKR